MAETGKLRYYLGLAAGGLIALGGALELTSVEYWGAVGVLLTMTAADMLKHRND